MPFHEEAVGSLTYVPTAFLWNQSHTGLVDVDENSFSCGSIQALQTVTPAPQCRRLATVLEIFNSGQFWKKKIGRFLDPVSVVFLTCGPRTEADMWTLFPPAPPCLGKRTDN